MRRKSERVVKNSPIKRTEASTNRRTTRRTAKSPEKTVNDEQSDNSSEHASSSDNEPEEIVLPKKTRRTSRTIEKSSSAEEIKVATPRPRRRAAAKKEADIKEEDEQITDKPEHEIDECVTKADSMNIISSNEIEETKSNLNIDGNETTVETNIEPKMAETVEKNDGDIENANKIETNDERETPKTNRKRTLRRTDKVDNDIEIKNDADGNDDKEPDEMVKQNEREKSPTNDESNDKNVTAVDTTANETTIEDSSAVCKKKTIVRKRKWLSNKTSASKVQEITISTDSLKGLISDVKPVPLSDIKLDSSPELDHESDDVKVVSSTSVDYNRHSEERVFESTDEINAVNITTSRKVSIVNESENEQPLSPAKNSSSNILYITNLVRPFTVLQLKILLQRTGKIAEDGFWIDKIKSKCFVKYETEDEAVETRHALHGIRWPTSNPKCLNVDFGTESLMEKAMASTADEIKTNKTRDDHIASSNELTEPIRDKTVNDRPVREWDLGKKDSHRSRETERSERKDVENKPRDARVNERDKERDRGDRRRRSNSTSPNRKYTKKDNEPPLRLLDDLFRKTKTTPCIYWLPLTPEQIAIRIEERKKAIERREAMRKEREREENEERNRRREREKRRDESREKDKRRDESRDRRDRHRDERDIKNRRRY